MGKSIDLTNKVFGTWTCINHIEKGVWLCRCENVQLLEYCGHFGHSVCRRLLKCNQRLIRMPR